MSKNLYKTLLAGAIAALIGAPAWVVAEPPGSPAPGAEGPQPHETAPPTGMRSALGDDSIYHRTAEELHQLEVVDFAGETIGTIQGVVQDSAREHVYAVVSADGQEIVIPFAQMHLVNDTPQITGSLDTVAREYDAERYVEVKTDRPVGEFAALESLPPLPTRDPMRLEGDPKGGIPVEGSPGPEPRAAEARDPAPQ